MSCLCRKTDEKACHKKLRHAFFDKSSKQPGGLCAVLTAGASGALFLYAAPRSPPGSAAAAAFFLRIFDEKSFYILKKALQFGY